MTLRDSPTETGRLELSSVSNRRAPSSVADGSSWELRRLPQTGRVGKECRGPGPLRSSAPPPCRASLQPLNPGRGGGGGKRSGPHPVLAFSVRCRVISLGQRPKKSAASSAEEFRQHLCPTPAQRPSWNSSGSLVHCSPAKLKASFRGILEERSVLMCLRLIVFCILASIVATLKVKKERCAITKRTNLGPVQLQVCESRGA